MAEAIANLDIVDALAPGGAAYKAFMLRSQMLQLETLARELEAVQ